MFTLYHRVALPVRDSLQPLSVILLLSLVSCNKDVLFDDTKRVPGGVWNQYDKLIFEVPIDDTINSYRFLLNIRHSTNYRYSNFFLFINSFFPDGNMARDTVECMLARPDGKWLGKGFAGMKDNQLLLRTGLRFPMKGIYIFEFEQGMREKSLEGISDIGFRIERE